MSIDIKVFRPREFIRTRVDGEIDFNGSINLIINISEINTQPNNYNIQIDSRKAKYKLTTADLFFLLVELLKYKNIFNNHIALLVKKEFFDDAEFLELCSKNRGINLEAFDKYEEAIDWLMSFEK